MEKKGGPIQKESKIPVFEKGELLVNFPKTVSEFENAMQKFPVKQVLYRALFRGKGLEFDSYRTFDATADDASAIDWRASLRSNTLLAKRYMEERDLNVYFILDVSNSMLFGSGNKLKAEYVAEMVAALSHLVLNSGDRAGLIMFGGEIAKVLHPSSSRNQFALFAKSLSDSSFYGGDFNFDSAVEYLLEDIGSARAFVILISDFIKVKKSSERFLRLLGSKFETVALMVRDPMDERLPKTSYQLSVQDPYSGRQKVLDPAIAAEKFREMVVRQKSMIKELFKKSRIDFLELDSSKSFVIPVASFLKTRALGGRS
jgi:uncharacterized protein (DUF58 family)